MRLVIFGGTTEGRVLAEKAAALKIPVIVSVSTEYGAELLKENAFLTVHQGNLTEEEMEQLLLSWQAELCMDATHPYAELVTKNVRKACEKLALPYFRILRKEEATDAGEDRVSVKSVEEAAFQFRRTLHGKDPALGGSHCKGSFPWIFRETSDRYAGTFFRRTE